MSRIAITMDEIYFTIVPNDDISMFNNIANSVMNVFSFTRIDL